MSDKPQNCAAYFEIGRSYKMDGMNYVWMRNLMFRCTGHTETGSALLSVLYVNPENHSDGSALITVLIQTENQMKMFSRVTHSEYEYKTVYGMNLTELHSNLRSILGYPVTEVLEVMPKSAPLANLKTGSMLSAVYRHRPVIITFDVSKHGHITPYYKVKGSLFRRKIFGNIAPIPKVPPSTMGEVMFYINNTFSKVVIA